MFKNKMLPLLLIAIFGLSPVYSDKSSDSSSRETIHASKACFKKLGAKEAKIKKLSVKEVENPIGRTYVIGEDFATIQAGIDLVNSGLKPDSAFGPVPAFEDENVILEIPAGTYNESLLIDNSLSDATFGGNRSLILHGDLRPIAAMTYLNGGQIRTNAAFTTLGTIGAAVSLVNSGNTITVNVSTGSPPNFVASAVVAGDVILVVDYNGTVQERNVLSVSANSITYDGSPVTITAGFNGAALIICPNVHIIGNNEVNAFAGIYDGAVDMTGIWFSVDPNIATTATGIQVLGNGYLYASRMLYDDRNSQVSSNVVTVSTGGTYFGGNSTGSGHQSIIGGVQSCFGIGFDSNARFGHYYALQRGGLACALIVGDIFLETLQMNGLNTLGLFANLSRIVLSPGPLIAFNNSQGIFADRNSVCSINGGTILDRCTTGISATEGNFVTRFPMTVTNCTTGIDLSLGSIFNTSSSLTLTNCTNGIVARTSSKFGSSSNIIFNGVTNLYAVDESSDYKTPNNTGTNPSPSDVFTYTTAGVQPLNSVYLKQLLDSTGVVALELNPALVVSASPIYRGKIYTLTAITAGPHTLTLTAGATFVQGGSVRTFSGIGSTMTIEVVSNTQVSILASSGVV